MRSVRRPASPQICWSLPEHFMVPEGERRSHETSQSWNEEEMLNLGTRTVGGCELLSPLDVDFRPAEALPFELKASDLPAALEAL